MLSFHGSQEIKDKYLSRVLSHQKADRIIQGTGWEKGKGCAVGCTLENYDASRYPIELGLPIWLADLEDIIFENLPKGKALEWPANFLKVIKPGISEEQFEELRHKLSIRRQLRNLKIQQESYKLYKMDYMLKVVNCIKLVIDYHTNYKMYVKSDKEREKIQKEALLIESEVESAKLVAESAARSVKDLAWSAESAAWSVSDLAWSAMSAEASAAWSVAESAAWSVKDLVESARAAAASVAWSVAGSAAWSAALPVADLADLAESERSAAKEEWSTAMSARTAAWEAEYQDLLELLSDISN